MTTPHLSQCTRLIIAISNVDTHVGLCVFEIIAIESKNNIGRTLASFQYEFSTLGSRGWSEAVIEVRRRGDGIGGASVKRAEGDGK
jgi:hypothetical protein